MLMYTCVTRLDSDTIVVGWWPAEPDTRDTMTLAGDTDIVAEVSDAQGNFVTATSLSLVPTCHAPTDQYENPDVFVGLVDVADGAAQAKVSSAGSVVWEASPADHSSYSWEYSLAEGKDGPSLDLKTEIGNGSYRVRWTDGTTEKDKDSLLLQPWGSRPTASIDLSWLAGAEGTLHLDVSDGFSLTTLSSERLQIPANPGVVAVVVGLADHDVVSPEVGRQLWVVPLTLTPTNSLQWALDGQVVAVGPQCVLQPPSGQHKLTVIEPKSEQQLISLEFTAEESKQPG